MPARAAVSRTGVPGVSAEPAAPAPPWTHWLGTGLIVGYVAQWQLGWTWEPLAELQRAESYKRWSGLLLLAGIAAQWLLTGLRLGGRMKAAKVAYRYHEYLGALLPAGFYLHAVTPGFGYLLVLAGLFYGNTVLGLGHDWVADRRNKRLKDVWLVAHVSLAVAILLLAAYHVYIAFSYS